MKFFKLTSTAVKTSSKGNVFGSKNRNHGGMERVAEGWDLVVGPGKIRQRGEDTCCGCFLQSFFFLWWGGRGGK